MRIRVMFTLFTAFAAVLFALVAATIGGKW